MTKQEEIQDLKRRAQNKSLPASAVAALNKMIAELEKSEPKKEPKKSEFTEVKKNSGTSKIYWNGNPISSDKENGKYNGRYGFEGKFTFDEFVAEFLKTDTYKRESELEKEEPKKESKSEGSVGKKSKIKDWYLKEYSSDKLGKKLNDDSTFSDLLIAISKGNDVYAVLGVADSVVRERAFAKLSKIENKEGQWAYNTWLSNDEDSEGKKETSKAKTDDLASVRVIANEMAKNAGFKSAKVDDLGNEAYLIEISPSSTKDDSQDGMVLNKYKDGTFEVAEMQAGKGGNFINVFGEYKTLKPALTQLLKGNKQKPVKVIDMRSETEKSEEKKESKKPDYDCDELIEKAKKAAKKAKESAKKSANKPEVTKAKEKIERTHETIEKKIEKGEFTKAQISKLIGETKDLLKMLEKALKSL